MPPITVDPEVLSGAGESIGAVGDEIAAAVSTLASGLSGGARSGLDPAGLAFGHAYGQSAQALLDAGAAAVNAGRGIGFGVQMSATNYSRADASSTIGGGASTLTPPDAPAEFSAPASPSAVGGGVPPPLLWSVIQTFIPDVWPDGDPAALRASASAWQGFASTITGIAGHLAGPSGVVAGQQIPEGGNMASAISELTQSLSGIASEAGKLATQTMEFADDVENTQNAIRDLLDRVSPSGLWDGIQAVFSGDALEELKEIADDVKAVLEGYGHQAEGRRDILQIAMGMIDDAVVSVEKWARREFPRYLGDDVGNALATALDFELTLGQGILAGGVDMIDGIGQLDPLRFAYDPDGAKETWSALAETLGEGMLYSTPTGMLANPAGAVDYWTDRVKDSVHAEDWSSDRPGYGLGKIFFDVGAAVVPGGPALRTSKVAADAAGDAASAAARPGRVPDVPSGAIDNITPIGARAEDITTKLNNLDDNIPTTATPNPSGPAIPPSLAEPPDAPRIPDTPGVRVPDSPQPHVPDSSTPHVPNSSTPHVPDSTPNDRSPAPHSSTPTGNPAQEPAGAVPESRVPAAVDAPSAPHQTAPAPSASSVPTSAGPPVASHAPDSPPSAAPHAQTSPDPPSSPAGHAPGPATVDSPSPEAPSPDRSDVSASSNGDGTDHPETPKDSDVTDTPSEGTGTAADHPAHSREAVPGVDYSLPPNDALQILHDPAAEIARLAEGKVPASILEGYDPLAGRTPDQFQREFTFTDANGKVRWDWDGQAPNNGFAGDPFESDRIPQGHQLDRLGSNGGGFMADEGAPMADRAMPPGAAAQYHTFEGTGRPIPPGKDWVVMHGPAKDAFGQPGGAEQWVVIDRSTSNPGYQGDQVPVEVLIRERLLRETTPPE